ncbi:ATP-binding protein [Oscillatoria acuminata]|uniref:Nephrocystin 3-like N-terminal domain-containing protein n=1 Tax=Oscillatoria acuminata PCC 6304 TaxID=56110 RepID=K9TMW0_9CYAN|nr:ATP-binding protein [Oscillatoria acuminata]AFY83875.1 hypothetical protein Oscil6304_4353 [Oscillatoria acuminata PCC 6304]
MVLQIIKEHKLLLGVTALLSIGSVVAGGATAIPLLAEFASPLLNSMAATKLLDLAKKLRDSSQVLTNEDLPKAAGRAIALGILHISQEDKYREIAPGLESLARKTEKYWLQIERDRQSPGDYLPIREPQLRYVFAANAAETAIATLDLESWQKLITWLMEQHQPHLPAEIGEYQDAIDAISQHLYKRFSHNLREVLKQDAREGGPAFSGMVLDLLRDNLAQTHQQALKQQDIIQILTHLETGIRDELGQLRGSFQQFFDLTKPRLPIRQECETLIADKIQDFVGRKYVFAAIRDFLHKNPKGYFILEADPGVGKSAILAKLVELSQGHCLTHFNSQGSGIIKPQQFLENICIQLIEGYHLDYPQLPEKTTEDGNVLARLLAEASKTLLPGEKLIVVVDALDEVDASSQTPGSNLLYLPDSLPDQVYFILSKRPKQLPLPLTDYDIPFDLMLYPAESARDARHYAEKRWQQSPQIQDWVTSRHSTPEQFFTELVAKSENNFMYLRYVLNDIDKGLYESETLDSLPFGLKRYYQKHWLLMGMNTDPLPIDKIRIIYVLSESPEPVSRPLLAELAGLSKSRVRSVLEEWEQFLRFQTIEREKCYSVYHASFSDFLNEQAEDSGIDLEDINRRMGDNLADGAPL